MSVEHSVAARRGLLATIRYKSLQLSISQEAAIDLLVIGQADQAVAHAVGVHRTSVTRWRLYHPQFQATLNERRAAVREGFRDAYRVLLRDAVVALQDEMRTPSPARAKVALELLRSSGLDHYDFESIGPTDPETIIDDAARDRARNQVSATRGSVSGAERRAALEGLLRQANEPPADDPPIGSDS